MDRLLYFDNGTLYKNIVDYFVSDEDDGDNGAEQPYVNFYPYKDGRLTTLIDFHDGFLQHPQLMSGEDPDERKANALKQSLDYIDIFLDKVFIMIMMVMTLMMVMTNEHKKTLASTGAQT